MNNSQKESIVNTLPASAPRHLSGPPVVCLYFILVNNWNKTGLEIRTFLLGRASSSNIIYSKMFWFPTHLKSKDAQWPPSNDPAHVFCPNEDSSSKDHPKNKERAGHFVLCTKFRTCHPTFAECNELEKKLTVLKFWLHPIVAPNKACEIFWAAVFYRLIV